MENFKHIIPLIFLLLILTTTCNSQNEDQVDKRQKMHINRSPAVAGQFYPANPDELTQTLENLFVKAKKKNHDNQSPF